MTLVALPMCACSLIVGSESRVVGTDAGRTADGAVVDAKAPADDANVVDAKTPADGAIACDPNNPCAAVSAKCNADCISAANSCTSECHGGPKGDPCRQDCNTTSTSCTSQCLVSCTSCRSSIGCSASGC